MSMRNQAGIVLPGYNPLKVANAPTIGTATVASGTSVSVAFTAPACVGGGAISSYTVFACCGVKKTSGASSPLVVTGLTTGTAYTFKAIATNAYGPSYPSAASNSATPAVIGQDAYTSYGTYSWVAPAGVTSVSVVAIGGGGGWAGGGGGLGYKNNYTVVPGNSYTVQVGQGGNAASFFGYYYAGNCSFFVSTAVVKGGGGGQVCGQPYSAGTYTGDGGGNGGSGSGGSGIYGGGAGAGGYSGAGGNGAAFPSSGSGVGANGTAGSGGGGGGGGTYRWNGACCSYYSRSGGGGGTGIYGQGSNGTAGIRCGTSGTGGGGGSGGGAGVTATGGGSTCFVNGGVGGLYGGGGGGGNNPPNNRCTGKGAVRIIWPGTTRSFPSTNTGNL